jgi:hypothetical protein
MSEFVTRMQRELARLQAENSQLKARGAAPAAPATTEPVPVPAAAPSGPARSALLASLHSSDLEKTPAPLAAELQDFLLFVSIRFLRSVERVVAYSAREFVEVLEMRTLLPDTDRNFSGRLADVIGAPSDQGQRRELDDYLRGLGRWLVASLAAHKKAAREFALDLKRALSEEALLGSAPISALQRITGQREAELWRRAASYLRDLSPDTLDDRIDRLARETAHKLLGGEPGNAGAPS